MAGRRVGVLAHDQHPHVGQRPVEGAQHVVARRQVSPPGRHLGPQEVTEVADLTGDRCQRLRPARVDQLRQRLGHAETLEPGQDFVTSAPQNRAVVHAILLDLTRPRAVEVAGAGAQ